MRIAVDAMGGDHAPLEIVKGAVEAARVLDRVTRIFLVGDEAAVRAELAKYPGVSDKIQVVHAEEAIGMDEAPALAIRKKKKSSIGKAVDLVKQGEADAVVSAGNTGAVVVAATLKLRMLDGVHRPGIATVMPTRKRAFVLIDAGANTDSPPELLRQFAVMGSVYSRAVLGCAEPVVGLLNIGEEEGKGNEVAKAAYGLLQQAGLNFRGNVEGHDLFEGETDVVVCDGFLGNVVLKTSESAATAIAHWMKQEFKRNPIRILGAILLSGAIRSMKRRLDPELYGGAPLLGVRGICIITHGASSHRAILHAIRVGCEAQQHRLNELITTEIARLGAKP